MQENRHAYKSVVLFLFRIIHIALHVCIATHTHTHTHAQHKYTRIVIHEYRSAV